MSFEVDRLGSAQQRAVSPPGVEVPGSAGFSAMLEAARDGTGPNAGDASVPTTPPPEVAAAIDTASQAYEQLNATGQQLHFTVDRPTGSLAVELRDLAGNQLSTLSATEALRIAGGKSPT